MYYKLGTKPFKYVHIPPGGLGRERIDEDGRHILQCHSRGDARFSPLKALIESKGGPITIEVMYQSLKRIGGKPIPIVQGNDAPCEYFQIGKWQGAFKEYRHEVFYLLYLMLFILKPSLYEEACTYQGFEDVFDSRGGETFYRDDPDIWAYCGPEHQAAQSRCIVWAVNKRPAHKAFHPLLREYATKHGQQLMEWMVA